jgi:4-hydroxy-4-methyl-2-oxoglutarate aldolase
MATENKELLKLYEDLRVADVRDGLDYLGYHHVGSVHHSIRPLFRARVFGIARTIRYVPFTGKVPSMTPEEYFTWTAKYYKEICTYPWMDEIEDGDICVIDMSGVNAGLLGSANTLNCIKKGCRGFVTNGGGVRDTDEIILQKIPFWVPYICQGMVQGRLQYDSRNCNVVIGGVTVSPGDIIVADGDGVIVVSRSLAREVAKLAHEEHSRDKKDRRGLYEALGKQLDSTVV